jgi:hypothetical protein
MMLNLKGNKYIIAEISVFMRTNRYCSRQTDGSHFHKRLPESFILVALKETPSFWVLEKWERENTYSDKVMLLRLWPSIQSILIWKSWSPSAIPFLYSARLWKSFSVKLLFKNVDLLIWKKTHTKRSCLCPSKAVRAKQFLELLREMNT